MVAEAPNFSSALRVVMQAPLNANEKLYNHSRVKSPARPMTPAHAMLRKRFADGANSREGTKLSSGPTHVSDKY